MKIHKKFDIFSKLSKHLAYVIDYMNSSCRALF